MVGKALRQRRRARREHPAGRAAFAARSAAKTGVYSFESKQPARLSRAFEKTFRAQRSAWTFFNAQPPGYRRLTTFWVLSAKQPSPRERRLLQLIAASARGGRL